ncbi:MAG: hypothetical protein H6733_06730 [Alphaproteobacteria bacterium]|nr:hypothetical protein [Alphaproteobacteria bacterium]
MGHWLTDRLGWGRPVADPRQPRGVFRLCPGCGAQVIERWATACPACAGATAHAPAPTRPDDGPSVAPPVAPTRPLPLPPPPPVAVSVTPTPPVLALPAPRPTGPSMPPRPSRTPNVPVPVVARTQAIAPSSVRRGGTVIVEHDDPSPAVSAPLPGMLTLPAPADGAPVQWTLTARGGDGRTVLVRLTWNGTSWQVHPHDAATLTRTGLTLGPASPGGPRC